MARWVTILLGFCAMEKVPVAVCRTMLNCWMTSCSHFIQIFWSQFLQHILDLVQFLALRRPQMSPTAYWPIFVPCPWPPINCKQQPQTKQSPPHHTKIVYQSLHSPLTLRNPKDGIPYHGVKKIFKSHQVQVTALSRWHHRSFLLHSWGWTSKYSSHAADTIQSHYPSSHGTAPQAHPTATSTSYYNLQYSRRRCWQRHGSSPIAAILNQRK